MMHFTHSVVTIFHMRIVWQKIKLEIGKFLITAAADLAVFVVPVIHLNTFYLQKHNLCVIKAILFGIKCGKLNLKARKLNFAYIRQADATLSDM